MEQVSEGSFTVADYPELPIRDDFTSLNARWESFAGTPAASGGVFSGGIAKRDFGRGDALRVLGRISTAPPSGVNYLQIIVCANDDATEYYALHITNGGFFLLESGSALDSHAVAPMAGDAVRLLVNEGGDIEVYLNDVLILNSSDTDLRENTIGALSAVGTCSWTVDETEGFFIVEAL